MGKTDVKLRTASGEALSVRGLAQMDLILGQHWHQRCYWEWIFLDKAGAVIDFRKKQLNIPGIRSLEI